MLHQVVRDHFETFILEAARLRDREALQVGAYMTVVLIVPRASPETLRFIAVLSLGTAVHGAALALVQGSARRACGYLFMSQSALVRARLHQRNRPGG